jgi:hypothetical protein
MGFRGKHKNKRDGNETAIVLILRGYGFSVEHMDKPVDLVVGFAGRDYLVEVKLGNADLTGPQEIFFETWRGSKTIIRSEESAHEWAKMVRNSAFKADGLPSVVGQIS